MKDQQLSRSALLWQLLSVVVVSLPHITHLPYWVTLVVALCIVWRLMVYSGRWSLPPWWVKTFLVFTAGVGVLASYKQGGGISVTVALLIVGFGLKVIELYSRRDSLVVLYVAYLVASTAFLFSQGIGMALYVITAITLVTTALMSTNLTRETHFFFAMKRTSIMLLPAFPLMIVLFIGMPRLGPLWEIGLDKTMAKTGLSDSMAPGDITRLTRSAEVAFRVSFDGNIPDQSQLYWRSIVLNDFDGKRWFNRDIATPVLMPVQGQEANLNKVFQYEIILEATQKKYIPVLDYLTVWPAPLTAYADMTLYSNTQITNRQQYRLESHLNYYLGLKQTESDYERALSLPEGNNAAIKLARRWWDESSGYQEYIGKIKQYYNESFYYSLAPPPLGDESVSDFLLETKTGFCGHFASATTLLLRAVGIPARVVTGYQGGEWNPYEDYFLVRQYDAHAWVEAWLPEQGWIRIDPTAWVAPSRVEQPADQTFSKDSAFLKESPLSAWGISSNSAFSQIRLRLESLNYGWHRWVLNYHHQQKGVLENLLGTLSLLNLALFLLLPFSVVISIPVFLMLKNSRATTLHPADKMISDLSNHFSREGLARSQGETVANYCHRLSRFNPDITQYVMQISQLYEKIRYEQVSDAQRLAKLKKNVISCIRFRKGLLARERR